MGETVRIDGSHGEGGGQILRTALSLSIMTGTPFEIVNIRKGRKNPGLQAQHLTAVRAARAISSADVNGDELGSTELAFTPRRAEAGTYHFNVAEERGSAGSVTLVLQAILLPLSFAQGESNVTIEGGTHVPWSPPYHFIAETFSTILSKLGFNYSFSIERWGWYPKGGGVVNVKIHPRQSQHIHFSHETRSSLKKIKGISAVSNLPLSIAERQKKEALRLLALSGKEAEILTLEALSHGTGTFLFLNALFDDTAAGFSALGARGKRAEEVASEAVDGMNAFLSTDAAIDPHIADQIILYLAVCGGKHSFTTSQITQHLATNLWTMQHFLTDCQIRLEGEKGKPGRIALTST